MCLQIAGKEQRRGGTGNLERALCFLWQELAKALPRDAAWFPSNGGQQTGHLYCSLYREVPTLLLSMTWESFSTLG